MWSKLGKMLVAWKVDSLSFSIALYSSFPFPTELKDAMDDLRRNPLDVGLPSPSALPFTYVRGGTSNAVGGATLQQDKDTATYNNGKSFLTMHWSSLDNSQNCQVEACASAFQEDNLSDADKAKLNSLSVSLKELRNSNEKQVKKSLWDQYGHRSQKHGKSLYVRLLSATHVSALFSVSLVDIHLHLYREVYELAMGHLLMQYNVRLHSIKDLEGTLMYSLLSFLAVYTSISGKGSSQEKDVLALAGSLKESKAFHRIAAVDVTQLGQFFKLVCAPESAVIARNDATFLCVLRLCCTFMGITDPHADGTSDLLRCLLVKEGVPDDGNITKLKDTQRFLYLLALRVIKNTHGKIYSGGICYLPIDHFRCGRGGKPYKLDGFLQTLWTILRYRIRELNADGWEDVPSRFTPTSMSEEELEGYLLPVAAARVPDHDECESSSRRATQDADGDADGDKENDEDHEISDGEFETQAPLANALVAASNKYREVSHNAAAKPPKTAKRSASRAGLPP